MELRQVETFLKVAELGSFSRAAARLGYSQSAVTMQVKQLEAELGARLFDRLPRGAQLTDRGRAFAFHAQELRSCAERAAASVRVGDPADAAMVGTVRIGSVESISTAVLPDTLVAFHARYPAVELVVRTERIERLVEGVRANRLDLFATMDRPVSLRGLSRTLLREEDIVFACAPTMARGLGPLDVERLAEIPLVLTERGESYRLELERQLAERDRQLHPIVETGNTETLVHLAERGVGVAFLPRFSVASSLERGALVELEVEGMRRVHMASQLFVHREKLLTPPIAAFAGLLQEQFANTASSAAVGQYDGCIVSRRDAS